MMNDELFKNFSISCNHAKGQHKAMNFHRESTEAIVMTLMELIEEDESSEMETQSAEIKTG